MIWIKNHKSLIGGYLLLIFTFATSIPILHSYGFFILLTKAIFLDIRPLILVVDIITFSWGLSLILVK